MPSQIVSSDEQTSSALDALLSDQGTYKKYTFYLFIDVLDKYQEDSHCDHKALTNLLKNWVNASNGRLKSCISSREYKVSESAFPKENRIRLQGLTRVDMVQ